MVSDSNITSDSQYESNSHAQECTGVLLKIGKGNLPEENIQAKLPETLIKNVPTVEELIRSAYEDVAQILDQRNYLICESALLTPKNAQAAALNNSILCATETDEVVYTSINTMQ
ncbi:hypothetical protein CDAR_262591 [Caerostris darwini]|uniref:DNA helicase n=1 Tax=Caerostris darwini TaxID=1538125 RepID=A0AAV4TGU3_9ARAC|nr:hypothetical protein CDAR_262591 [Caerostris darwini]